MRVQLACLAVAGMAASTARAQPILSESFEQPQTSDLLTFSAGQTLTTPGAQWTITATGIELFRASAHPEAAAFDGEQAVELASADGPGAMETRVDVVPGGTYTFEFRYARNANLGATVATALFEVEGRVLTTVFHDPGEHAFNEFLLYSIVLTLDTSPAVIRFRSPDNGSAGIIIDAVTVAEGSVLCGSADFDCDGDLGTDADIEAFFRCLAGVCPGAPCATNPDFNGDGDIGTDADIEAFFRVLSGGSC